MTLTCFTSLLIRCLDSPGCRCVKLLSLTHSSQPKTVQICKVVAGTSCTLALYERMSPEILETASCRSQRLAPALITCSCVQ